MCHFIRLCLVSLPPYITCWNTTNTIPIQWRRQQQCAAFSANRVVFQKNLVRLRSCPRKNKVEELMTDHQNSRQFVEPFWLSKDSKISIKTIFILCSQNYPQLTWLRVRNINGQFTVPPLYSSLFLPVLLTAAPLIFKLPTWILNLPIFSTFFPFFWRVALFVKVNIKQLHWHFLLVLISKYISYIWKQKKVKIGISISCFIPSEKTRWFQGTPNESVAGHKMIITTRIERILIATQGPL